MSVDYFMDISVIHLSAAVKFPFKCVYFSCFSGVFVGDANGCSAAICGILRLSSNLLTILKNILINSTSINFQELNMDKTDFV